MEWALFCGIIIILLLLNSNNKTVIHEGNTSTNAPQNIPNPTPYPIPLDPELSADRNRLNEWIQEECSTIINANTSRHLFSNKKLFDIVYTDLLNTNEWKFKRNKILIRDGYICNDCGLKSRNLHVHHKCYIEDELPWIIDDIHLISLCYQCHKKIHDNQIIPVYRRDLRGDLHVTEKQTIYCYRCNGAGWFPQYDHVEEGICFRCRGNCIESTIFSRAVENFLASVSSNYEDDMIESINNYYADIGIEQFRQKIKPVFYPYANGGQDDLPF